MIGIIGGSGFEKFEEFETVHVFSGGDIETPFGKPSSGFKKVRIKSNASAKTKNQDDAANTSQEFLFISRHGDHHELLPSEINYCANIYALKKLGATAIVSFSAVGSLQKDYAPGDMVIPYQYIDRTKSLRRSTFLGEGLIGHVSLAKPICEVMAKKLEQHKKSFNFKIHSGLTYVCIEGPYFSTKAESNTYRQMPAHIIGMSNFPEYALAREAGLPYLPCCFVTDYDCWDDSIPHVTVEEVIKVMRLNNQKAFQVLKTVLQISDISQNSAAYEGGLRTGLFMPPDAIPADKKAWVDVLVR